MHHARTAAVRSVIVHRPPAIFRRNSRRSWALELDRAPFRGHCPTSDSARKRFDEVWKDRDDVDPSSTCVPRHEPRHEVPLELASWPGASTVGVDTPGCNAPRHPTRHTVAFRRFCRATTASSSPGRTSTTIRPGFEIDLGHQLARRREQVSLSSASSSTTSTSCAPVSQISCTVPISLPSRPTTSQPISSCQ